MRQIKSFAVWSTLLIIVFACEKDDNENDNNMGETSSIYYQEFSVDTTNFSNDTVFYDVNNDGVIDIEVSRFIEIENPDVDYEGQFRWVNDPMSFCYMKNTLSTSMIDLGDEINGNSGLFEWRPVVNYSGGTGIVSENHYWAHNVFTDYFGFKYNSDQDTQYGWFRFKHFELAEMAINITPNEPILVGQKE